MTRRAWVYIWGVLLTGAGLSGLAIWSDPAVPPSEPLTFAVLLLLTLLAQFLEAVAPGRNSYYPHLVFLFAGVLLLHPFFFVLLVAIPHLVEWLRKRLANSPLLRDWYIQPFNIATHLIAGIVGRWLFLGLTPDAPILSAPHTLIVATASAVTYVLINHLLIGLALSLARGISLRESGVLDLSNLLSDLVQLCLGYVVAILWQISPWLMLPALTPLVMIYRALSVPQLEQEAHTDSKTGLWNARHFTELFTSELERARRFDRPVALVMADLDLLRNINNTYGHLAGDAVLAGIGRIIRETVREFDIPARFGGEEFSIGLLEADVRQAEAFAERLREAVATTPFEVQASLEPIRVTMSLGVACFPGDAIDLNDLIHQADLAVYQAKLRGRNCVVCAADVPHSIKLENVPVEERVTVSHPAAQATRPAPANANDSSPRPASKKRKAAPADADPSSPRITFPLFVGGVIALGLLAAILGPVFSPWPDPAAVALLVALAMLAELFQVNVYEANTVSVSAAIVFAAALFTGVPGVAAVSAGIVLVHYLQMRPQLYKTAFNWSTHVLAGSVPAWVVHAQRVSLQSSNLLVLGVLAVATAVVYYMIETGLIALAISLSQRASVRRVWREQFRWLAGHYLVLCGMGMFLAVAHHSLGLIGVIVFALPVFMMHYAQKQYVERTEESVSELRRMNRELGLANREVVDASRAIRRLNDELFLTLAKIIDARDPHVAGHAAKVAEYATAVANRMGLEAERLELIRQAALLHDIGKLGIPERILHKPAGLAPEEYATIKTHTTLGSQFLETCQGLRHLAPIVKGHHEWWNGRGYPGELRGEQIPLEARILAVCDAAEAMASDRPYRRSMPWTEIVAELLRCAGTQFDPMIVEEFIHTVERDGQALVSNSTREAADRRVAREGDGVRLGPSPEAVAAAAAFESILQTGGQAYEPS